MRPAIKYKIQSKVLTIAILTFIPFFIESCNKPQNWTNSILLGTTGDFDKGETPKSCSSKIKVSLHNPKISGNYAYPVNQPLSNVLLIEDGDQDYAGVIHTGAISGMSGIGAKERRFCVSLTTPFKGEVQLPVSITGNESGNDAPKGRLTVTAVGSAPLFPGKLMFTNSGDTNGFCYDVKVTAGNWGKGNDKVDPTNPITINIGKPVLSDQSGIYTDEEPCSITFRVDDDKGYGTLVGNISNPISEDGGTATFKVRLRRPPAAGKKVIIPINDLYDSINANRRHGTVSPASLEFTSAGTDWETPKIVTVKGNKDNIETDTVQWLLELKNIISDDPDYNGKKPRNIAITTLNTDKVGFIVADASGAKLHETNGTVIVNLFGYATDDMGNLGSKYATYKIKLRSKPQADVILTFKSDSAHKDGIFTPLIKITPSEWDVFKTVTVVGSSDNTNEDGNNYFHNYIVSFDITSEDSGYKIIKGTTVNMNIRSCDNDVDRFIQRCDLSKISNGSLLTTNESGGTASTWFITQKKPTTNITLPFSYTKTSANDEVKTPITSVTITASNYNTLSDNILTVNGENDSVLDGPQNFTLIPGTSSGGLAYNFPSGFSVSGTNIDNEVAFYHKVFGKTKEGDETQKATIKVCPGSDHDQSLTLTFTCINTRECKDITPKTLTFAPHVYCTKDDYSETAAVQSVAVTGADDEWSDGDQTYRVTAAIDANGDTIYHENNGSRNPWWEDITNEDNDLPAKVIFKSSPQSPVAGGIKGLDLLCNSEKSGREVKYGGGKVSLSGKTFKALVVGNGDSGCSSCSLEGTRSVTQNWVLKPYTYYYLWTSNDSWDESDRLFKTDGNGKFTKADSGSDAGVINYDANKGQTLPDEYWTGMMKDMSSMTSNEYNPPPSNANDPSEEGNCAGWRLSQPPSIAGNLSKFYKGKFGNTNNISADDEVECKLANKKPILCVEQ